MIIRDGMLRQCRYADCRSHLSTCIHVLLNEHGQVRRANALCVYHR
jgi:hypothetical protein